MSVADLAVARMTLVNEAEGVHAEAAVRPEAREAELGAEAEDYNQERGFRKTKETFKEGCREERGSAAQAKA